MGTVMVLTNMSSLHGVAFILVPRDPPVTSISSSLGNMINSSFISLDIFLNVPSSFSQSRNPASRIVLTERAVPLCVFTSKCHLYGYVDYNCHGVFNTEASEILPS